MTVLANERYFSERELAAMNFRKLGREVKISRAARLHDPQYMSIGDYSMIDDFCILSGNITIGRHVHIAHGCKVIAGLEGVEMQDFSGLAFGVTVFAQSDDYSGNALTNPTVPMQFRKIQRARVVFGRHVIVGTNSVVLPGVELTEGTSIGASSLVTKSTQPWSIYFGVPARRLKERSQDMLRIETEYEKLFPEHFAE
jgi:acetyltransferase-like isoleucine patch superfamily enzyme